MIGELDRRGAGPLQDYAAERIEHSPRPPREVPIADVVRLSYGSWPMRVAAGIALLFGIAVVGVAIALWRVALDPLLLLLLGVLFGIGIPLVPLVAGLRARTAIRQGAVVRAEVVEVTDRASSGQGPDAPTRVVGSAVPQVPDGAAQTRFDVEAPWAAEVDVGDVIVGLVPARGPPLWLGRSRPRDPDAG